MKKSPSFKKYVLLSIAVHILVFGAFYLVETLQQKFPKQESVSIDLLTPEEMQKLVEAQEAGQIKKVPVPTAPKNQIVEQSENSINETEPVDSRFLSAKNQTVTKQSVAKEHGEFQNIKKAAPQKTGPKGDGKIKSTAKAEAKPTPEQKEKIVRDLFKSFDASEALERQKLADRKKDQGAEQGQGLGRGNNEDIAKEGADTSRSNDYLKDVDQGLETMLNTREFKYYSYYNRIRRQLAQHWEGRVREKLSRMFKEGRAPASTGQDRVTKLMIVLNDRGTLVNVQVMSDSGVRDLDDAAIEAFRAAAPFPNPPKGIIEGDGTVKIRWDFVLES